MSYTLLHLMIEFLLIGTFSFGGGMATIPFLFNLADKYTWFTRNELVDMIAISEVTPGPIGVNMATYVGMKSRGVLGSLVSILSLTFPAIIVMMFAYKYLLKSRSLIVDRAFYGLKPVVLALFASGLYSVMKETLFTLDGGFHLNLFEDVLFVVIFAVSMKFKKIHPTLLILASGAIGALKYFIMR